MLDKNECANQSFELEIEKMKLQFFMEKNDMINIANKLNLDMINRKYLMMLPSKLRVNNIDCVGEYIALDFGGTNIRISIYRLKGNGIYEVIEQRKFPLKGEEYNYLSGEYDILDVFSKVAENIKEMIEPNKRYYLGHSLSRAFVSKDINHAVISKCPAGFNIKNFKGCDVNETLNVALKKYNLNVEPVSVINDTTAVLAGGKYLYSNVDMSCVVGTGYNMGMIDKNSEIINTESDAFSDFDLGYYDEKYVKWRDLPKDKCNLMNGFVAPGEKAAIMARLVMEDFVNKGLIEPIDDITPQVLSSALRGDIDEKLSKNQKVFIKEVAKAIYSRGAKLIACQIYAILATTDSNLKHEHGVIFEGSTAMNVPYIEYIKEALYMLYGEESSKIKCYLKKDVAMLGAAVSAAMVSKGID